MLSVEHAGISQDGAVLPGGEAQRKDKTREKSPDNHTDSGFALLMQGLVGPGNSPGVSAESLPVGQGHDRQVPRLTTGDSGPGHEPSNSFAAVSPNGKGRQSLLDSQNAAKNASIPGVNADPRAPSPQDLLQVKNQPNTKDAPPLGQTVTAKVPAGVGESSSVGTQINQLGISGLAESTKSTVLAGDSGKTSAAVRGTPLPGVPVELAQTGQNGSFARRLSTIAGSSDSVGQAGSDVGAKNKVSKNVLSTDNASSSTWLAGTSTLSQKAGEVGQSANPMQSQASLVVDVGENNGGHVLGSVVASQLQGNVAQLQVHVHPQNLGELLITAVQTEGQVYVHILGSTAATVQWLQQVTPDLIAAVRLAGFSEARVDIDLGSGQSGREEQFLSSNRANPVQRMTDGGSEWNLPVGRVRAGGKVGRYGGGNSGIDLRV